MTDFRALCAKLVDDLELCDWPYKLKEIIRADIDCARAALADGPAVPQPQPPAEGEVEELVAWLREIAQLWEPDAPRVKQLSRAADLLQRLSPLQPVPVSERLPGPEDCDAEGRCWWWYPEVPGKTYGYWAHEDDAVPERAFNEQPLHWLPAHALPLPAEKL